MEFDLWYLVFVPVLFFAGWWCRGFDQKQRGESEKVPEITTKGLALLLDGESDKAIDAFIEVVFSGTCFVAGGNLNERFVCIGISTIVRIFLMKNVP